MNEQDIKNWKNLRFTITKKFKNTVFEMITVCQILEESKLASKEKKHLKQYLIKLNQRFLKELEEQNPIQLALIRSYFSSKKEIDK